MLYLVGPLVCVCISIIYVSSLYVWNTGTLYRDHPKVIIRRSISVFISSAVAIVVTWAFTGDVQISLRMSPLTIFQTLVLMLGPIYDQLSWSDSIVSLLPPFSLVSFRNIFVAPICEEIVFRECFFRILKFSGYSNMGTAILAPCLFALAHAHHYKDITVFQLMGQIAHTCVFGWLAFYFLIRGSVLDCIISHSLCNAIGLPKESKSKKRSVIPYLVGLSVFIYST